MEKIKNLFDPGHKKDDSVLYGNEAGRSETTADVPREGAHAGSTGPGGEQLHWDPVHQRYDPPQSSGTGATAAQTASHNSSAFNPAHSQSRATDDRTDSSLRPTYHDTDTNASIKSGVQGYPPQSKPVTGSSLTGPHDIGDTNKPLPQAPTASGGLAGNNFDNGATTRNDIPYNTPAQTGAHSGGDTSDKSGRGFPLVGGLLGKGNGHDSHSTHAHVGGESHHSKLDPVVIAEEVVKDHTHHGHGHQYVGDPCPQVEPAKPHFTPGPHATDTANRLDPHVDARAGAPILSGATGTPSVSGTGPTSLSGTGPTSVSGTGPTSISGTAPTSAGITGTRPEHDSHIGRDATIAGATTAAAVGAYGASRDHPTTTAGAPGVARDEHQSPYSSRAVDPRLDSKTSTGLTAPRSGKHDDSSSSSDEEGGKKRGGGLKGLLHRDKTKKSTTSEQPATHDHHHTAAPVVATGAIPAAAVPISRENEYAGQQRAYDQGHVDHGHEKDGKHGGVLGFLHRDKDKEGAATEPHTVHHQKPHVEQQRVHDHGAVDHGHEKDGKHGGGVLGFLHRDKDKESAATEPHAVHVQKPHAVPGQEPHTEHGHNQRVVPVVAAGGFGVAEIVPDQGRSQELPTESRRYYEQPSAHDHEKKHGLLHNEKKHGDHHSEKKHDDHDGEKKHGGGLLGFLHRDKDKEHTSTSTDKHATAPVVEPEPVHDRHHQHEHAHAPKTTAEAYDLHGEHNKLHKDPPPGYYEEVAARRAHEHDGSTTGLGPEGRQHDGSQIVTEPHTGLPVNVGKYGDGHGGTDANTTIPGVHRHT